MIIYVDADACPVKDEVIKVAARHTLSVYMVSNAFLRNISGLRVHCIVVAEGADGADDWIVEQIEERDIFVTADILLAERCIKKKASGLKPTGKEFTSENIGSTVAMRNLSSHLRETGEISRHNKPFDKKDRSAFLQTLEKIIQHNLRHKA